jgi:hypothetical protein
VEGLASHRHRETGWPLATLISPQIPKIEDCVAEKGIERSIPTARWAETVRKFFVGRSRENARVDADQDNFLSLIAHAPTRRHKEK